MQLVEQECSDGEGSEGEGNNLGEDLGLREEGELGEGAGRAGGGRRESWGEARRRGVKGTAVV